MKSTQQKLILIAFLLAVLTATLGFMYLRSLEAPQEQAQKVGVLVAAETIPPRTLIEGSMIKEIEVEDHSLFVNYMNQREDIVGQYSKETIVENEGFYREKLVNESHSELSLRIPENHRALSIGVTGGSGVAHLIKAGDFVDVVVYIGEKEDEEEEIINPEMAKMFLQRLEVLAIDKQMNREEGNNGSEVPGGFLITLSVPVHQVEVLVLAENVGSIGVALRPLEDEDTPDTTGAQWEQLSINHKGIVVEENGEQENDADSDNADSQEEVDEDEEEANAEDIDNAGISEEEETTEEETTEEETTEEDYIYYRVKRGDTLANIAREFYGDFRKYVLIEEANDIEDRSLIVTGRVLKIPKAE